MSSVYLNFFVFFELLTSFPWIRPISARGAQIQHYFRVSLIELECIDEF